MAMDRADYVKFLDHLGKLGKWRNACPICGTRNWEAHGPIAMRSLAYERAQAAGFLVPSNVESVFPAVLLICKKCHYFHQFAWRPIEKGEGG